MIKKCAIYSLIMLLSGFPLCAEHADTREDIVCDRSIEDLADFEPEEDAEFEQLDFMIDKLAQEDLPPMVQQAWWKKMLISIGASLYMQYRAWHIWFCGNNEAQ